MTAPLGRSSLPPIRHDIIRQDRDRTGVDLNNRMTPYPLRNRKDASHHFPFSCPPLLSTENKFWDISAETFWPIDNTLCLPSLVTNEEEETRQRRLSRNAHHGGIATRNPNLQNENSTGKAESPCSEDVSQNSSGVVLSQEWFRPTGVIRQCLETFLLLMIGWVLLAPSA